MSERGGKTATKTELGRRRERERRETRPKIEIRYLFFPKFFFLLSGCCCACAFSFDRPSKPLSFLTCLRFWRSRKTRDARLKRERKKKSSLFFLPITVIIVIDVIETVQFLFCFLPVFLSVNFSSFTTPWQIEV